MGTGVQRGLLVAGCWLLVAGCVVRPEGERSKTLDAGEGR